MAMLGERAWMLPMLEGSSKAVPVAIPGRARDASLYSDMIDRAAGLWSEDLREFRAEQQKIEAEQKQLSKGSLWSRFETLLSATMTPALTGVGDAFVRRAILHRQQAFWRANLRTRKGTFS